jgi:phage FluMu gp28-like protein
VAPVYPQADIAYRRIKNSLTPGSFTAFASPFPRIELISGGTIWIKSADNPDSLFGEDVYHIVLDEASRAKPETWPAIVSVLTATKGQCRLIGNVKGRRNFFYNLARLAEKDELPGWHYAKITYQDAVDAGVLDEEIIADAKRTISEREFQELYEATAADDTGNPFGLDHIQACVKDLSNLSPVAWGIDLAKKEDWLVLVGLGQNGETCALHRWRGVPWRDSIRRIHSIVGEDTPALVDSTGVGDPVLEELQVEHGNFTGYMFSLVSKQKLMEGLAVSIQSHELGFPDGPIKNELESFEYSTTPSGRVTYAAAEGHSDDCVCALALARELWAETQPGANVTAWMKSETQNAREKLQTGPAIPRDNPFPHHSIPSIDLDNELTELYKTTLDSLTNPGAQLCRQCGQEVLGPSKISDGEFLWHMECLIGGVTKELQRRINV